jgi:hypothetical protein
VGAGLEERACSTRTAAALGSAFFLFAQELARNLSGDQIFSDSMKAGKY